MTTDVQTKKDAYKRGRNRDAPTLSPGSPTPIRHGTVRAARRTITRTATTGVTSRAVPRTSRARTRSSTSWCGRRAGSRTLPGASAPPSTSASARRTGARRSTPANASTSSPPPTGFRWNGTVGAQYKRMNQTTGGNLPPVQAKVSDDGRTLTFTYHVHLNTSDQDKDCIVYTCGLEAVDGAPLGRHTDGVAQVGTAPPAKLKAEVVEDED
ncbi:hypothetical protein LT493_36250 [Streptomyces tricolor]|nr:hypothetical protein [Streptomyces tricolor]